MKLVVPETVGVSAERLAKINPVMQKYTTERRVAGIVTLAARHGEIFHHEAFGWQDIKRRLPMRTDTIFRIYSMTKPIVSVALMQLFEEGKFRLNDPVSRYIPEFEKLKVSDTEGNLTDPNRPMTIHHLLTHSSGLSYGFFEDHPVEAQYREAKLFDTKLTLEEMIQKIGEIPLVYHPGERWRYSVATDVVGYLVQLLSDMPLGDYLQEKILLPLEMFDTDYEVPADKVGRFATMYGQTEDGNPLGILDDAHTSPHTRAVTNQRGGSGLVSTAADYIQFAQMIANKGTYQGKRYLGRKTLEYMVQNHIPTDLFPLGIGTEMPGIGFGLGFSSIVDTAAVGELGSLGNHGWSGAADTHFWVDPVENLIGMVLTQYMPSGTWPIRQDFTNLLYQALE